MNVCRFGFTPQRALKQLLGSDIVSAIEFDYAAIVQGISVTRQGEFRPQASFGHREISARARGDFRYGGILLDQRAESIASLCVMPARKFPVRGLKSFDRRSFVASGL